MNRREFCVGLGSMAAMVAANRAARPEQAAGMRSVIDPDPSGGYTLDPPRQFLFMDYRHIRPGDLTWRSPEGRSLPVAGPPEPAVDAAADAGGVARGIRLVAQKAAREGPIDGLPSRILYEDGRYLSWSIGVDYGAGRDLGSYSEAPAKSLAIGRGESRDGYAWDFKEVCRITPPAVSGIDGEYFFIDPHGPAEDRYKCLYHALVLGGQEKLWKRYQKVHPRSRDTRLSADMINCLYGLVSPDGVNWNAIPEPLMIHKGDTDNTVYFDEWLGRYVLYTRLYWMDRRMVARAESEDFRHWTPVEPIIRPRLDDPLSWDVYTNGRTGYPGVPGYHLMFPIFYRRLTQTSEVHLHTSINGIHWDRVPGGPVLEPGEPGSWDGEYLVAGKQLVPLGKDRVAIPYVGFPYPHKYPRWPGVLSSKVGWAVWPRGRLCALRADEEGRFSTFPVQVTGGQLHVNVKAHRAGEIRVGLSGVEGRSVDDCDPITGDHLDRPVTWKGDSRLRVDPGRSATLWFRLRAADLFGFEFA
ncbi:MAG TPA: hypothetical protein VLM89_15025 [Phycisphaerae bacterium]|nr:hypothetical protein [Phycisphaerae bacterium]